MTTVRPAPREFAHALDLVLREQFRADLVDAERPPIASATARASPVRRTVRRPIPRSARDRLDRLGRSASATSIVPRNIPARARRGSRCRRRPAARCRQTAMPRSARNARLPATIVARRRRRAHALARASTRTAPARGAATASAVARNGARERDAPRAARPSPRPRGDRPLVTPAAGRSATTSGRPNVSVPVLSRTIVSARPSTSSATPPLMIAPWRAARPIAPRIASGVPAAMPQAPADDDDGDRRARRRASRRTSARRRRA